MAEDPEARLRRVTRDRTLAETVAADRRFAEDSRRQLLAVVKKKVTTSFIGALSRIEQRFGHLWGHGKGESQCTPDEWTWRLVWEALRQDVLTNGNNQVRAVEKEFDQYEVRWHRFQTTLPAVPPAQPNE